MTEKVPTNNKELIDYRLNLIDKRLESMEGVLRSLSFVKQSDFDKLTDEVRREYVRKDSIKWLKTIGVTVAGVLTAAILIGVLNLVGGKL